MTSVATRQLPLVFPARPALGRADFMVTPANAHAAETVLAPRLWPNGRLALIGPAGAGKTHLAHALMAEAAAALAPAMTLTAAKVPALAACGVAIVEDVDRLAAMPPAEARPAEDALFHLFNLAAAGETRLLVTGRGAARSWRIRTPDLASRLQSLTVAEIAVPDDALLSSLLLKQGRDRGLDIAAEAATFLATRVDRSFAGLAAAVEMLDKAAAQRQRRHVTLALAAAAYKEAQSPVRHGEE